MNKKIGMISSLINALTVLLFAIFLITGFSFGYYFVCIFLSISFMCMTGAFNTECTKENEAAGKIALVLSGVYATLIMIVYFTQCTTVHNETLGTEAAHILNYHYMGLMFNLDMLGYGIMALSTFFMGLTIKVRNGIDKWLKILLLGHGLFFPGCLILPMTGMFLGSEGSSSMGGMIALEIWCLYFLPIGILSYLHFKRVN
ncbi:MAG: hypothetical protein K6E68_03920 [Lachnospiraceae bacterium]|nr:hypothetical protein [Lachnospiraceae bacterium]